MGISSALLVTSSVSCRQCSVHRPTKMLLEIHVITLQVKLFSLVLLTKPKQSKVMKSRFFFRFVFRAMQCESNCENSQLFGTGRPRPDHDLSRAQGTALLSYSQTRL